VCVQRCKPLTRTFLEQRNRFFADGLEFVHLQVTKLLQTQHNESIKSIVGINYINLSYYVARDLGPL
jgi:hypothetical protein